MKEIKDLNELKSLELEIMKKIHLFCEEKEIKYYLGFGTLIGAVRHQGFIPWDDDIDIYMPRPDYERFLELFPNEAKGMDLEIVNHKTKRYFGRCMSKVIDVKTVLLEKNYKSDDLIGVFVDVWPLDGLPNNSFKRKIHAVYSTMLKKILLSSSMVCKKDYSFLKRLVIRVSGVFNSKKIVIKLDKIATKYPYEESKYIKCYSARGDVFNKELFDERILSSFEDAEFYIPREYDYILTKIYGNYMMLPPIEQQKPHHIINTFYLEEDESLDSISLEALKNI